MTNPRGLMDSQVSSIRLHGKQWRMTSRQRSNLSSLRVFFPQSTYFRLAHEAIYKPHTCAKYRSLIEQILGNNLVLVVVCLRLKTRSANMIVRDILKSVT